MNIPKELKLIRLWLLIFVVLLVLSGVTAFPLEWELGILHRYLTFLPDPVYAKLSKVYEALVVTNKSYPFMAYGTDWLAFAHIVIGVAFIGPYRDPVKNIWVIEWGMIACMMVIPLAMIAGPLRGIPFYWRLIDCSFGVFGIIPLYYCRKLTLQLVAKTV